MADSHLRAIAHVTASTGESSTAAAVLHNYYDCFNERRFVEAAALFTDDAVLEQLPGIQQERGIIGYLQFVSACLRAFPDATMLVRSITAHDNSTFEVALDAEGTHQGALDLGGFVFRPSGRRVTYGLRELIQVSDGKIAFASLMINVHDIVDKLAQVDAGRLLEHIDRLKQLGDALRQAAPDSARARELTDEVGRELDAARHVVRPYYRH